ncbi:MAG TPA: exodeoxyribonuclease VII large subunit [Thermodesulfobacteriota bacterium]
MPLSSLETVLSVTELTSAIALAVGRALPGPVWVEGEVSNCRPHSAGHVYFTLKDDRACLRAVLFRGQARLLRFRIEDGQRLVCRGRVEIYAGRGEYQLIVDTAEPRGAGTLALALEQTRTRLAAEGLFDADRKRPIPRCPATVAVVTSPTGAALRDILNVLGRRAPGLHVRIVPVRVQGEGAAAEIAAAIQAVSAGRAADVVIVARGGGSVEDLWPFNEEAVVRAAAASAVPLVSAVGHETDVTLIDLAADLRAPTPSAAAELVAASAAELRAAVAALRRRLALAARQRLDGRRLRLAEARRRLGDPRSRLGQARLALADATGRLARAGREATAARRLRLAALAGRLDALSPLAILGRGYAVVHRVEDGRVVTDEAQVAAGDRLRVRVARGEIAARVERAAS